MTISKAFFTLVESRAEVSMKNNPSSSARLLPSSTLTSLMFSKSHLFPTSILATAVSQWAAYHYRKGQKQLKNTDTNTHTYTHVNTHICVGVCVCVYKCSAPNLNSILSLVYKWLHGIVMEVSASSYMKLTMRHERWLCLLAWAHFPCFP